MQRSTTHRNLAALAAALALSACGDASRTAGPALTPSDASAAKAPAVSVQPIDVSGGLFSEALDINGLGFAVGYRDPTLTAQWGRPTLWLPSGEAVDLPTLGSGSGRATAINVVGQVVGVSAAAAANGDSHAFLWTPGVGITDLGTLDDARHSVAMDINNRGWVVGHSGSAGLRAFLWTPAGGMQDLGSLGDGPSVAYAINDNGQVAGVSYPNGDQRAFLWTAGAGMRDLGNIPGGYSAEARGINNKGQVVGIAYTADGPHAFLWTAKGGMRDLGLPDGMVNAGAEDVNDNGQVVGWGYSPQSGYRPVVWTIGGGVRVYDAPTGASGIGYAMNGGRIAGIVFNDLGSQSDKRATIWR